MITFLDLKKYRIEKSNRELNDIKRKNNLCRNTDNNRNHIATLDSLKNA